MKLICHEGNPAQRLVAVDQTDNSVPEKNIKAKFCLGHPVQKKLVKLLWSSLTSFSFGEENANLSSCQDCRSVTRSSGVQEVKLSNNSERAIFFKCGLCAKYRLSPHVPCRFGIYLIQVNLCLWEQHWRHGKWGVWEPNCMQFWLDRIHHRRAGRKINTIGQHWNIYFDPK